jgi:DNA-binding NarL/FixJ family response regulator
MPTEVAELPEMSVSHAKMPEMTTRRRPDAQWPLYLMGQVNRPVRVALVALDDHLRHTVMQELLTDGRTDLVGHAPGAKDGRRLIQSREIDVLLVDLHLSDGTGFQLIEYVRQTHALMEVIAVSCADDEEHALRAFRCGANGFLLKNSWFGNYVEAVLQVANGGAAVTPSLLRRLVRRLRASGSMDALMDSERNVEREILSEREKVVLRMLAKGMTSSQVASQLAIGEQTVNSHVRSIYRKLKVHTRAQAVVMASNFGVL